MARVTRRASGRVVVHDPPPSLDAAHYERGRTGGGDGIATHDVASEDVPGDHVHDVRRQWIGVEQHERERVTHATRREARRIRRAYGRGAAHDSASANERRRVTRQIVVDEGVEIATIPVCRRPDQHGRDLLANGRSLGSARVVRSRRPGARDQQQRAGGEQPCGARTHGCYRFFLAGALAPLAAGLGADLAPALAPGLAGFDADPFVGAFAAALTGALAAAFAGAFAAGFAAVFTAGFAGPAALGAGAGGGGGGGAAGFTAGRGPPVRSENAPGRCGGAAAAAAAAAASRAAFSIAAFSAAIFEAVGRAFSLAGFFECASSASRMSLSASSCVIWPRRTMYCTRSRALSMANPASPAAALITSFIAEETLLPASWLMS